MLDLLSPSPENHRHHYKAGLRAWVMQNQWKVLCLSLQQGRVVMNRRWGKRDKRQVRRGRAQTPDAEQKHELPSSVRETPSSSPQWQDGRTHVISTHTIILYTEHVCVYMYITFIRVWILICLIIMVNRGNRHILWDVNQILVIPVINGCWGYAFGKLHHPQFSAFVESWL